MAAWVVHSFVAYREGFLEACGREYSSVVNYPFVTAELNGHNLETNRMQAFTSLILSLVPSICAAFWVLRK